MGVHGRWPGRNVREIQSCHDHSGRTQICRPPRPLPNVSTQRPARCNGEFYGGVLRALLDAGRALVRFGRCSLLFFEMHRGARLALFRLACDEGPNQPPGKLDARVGAKLSRGRLPLAQTAMFLALAGRAEIRVDVRSPACAGLRFFAWASVGEPGSARSRRMMEAFEQVHPRPHRPGSDWVIRSPVIQHCTLPPQKAPSSNSGCLGAHPPPKNCFP